MSKQLSQNYTKLGSPAEKQVFAKAISGDVVKKHKVLSKQHVLPEKRERKVQLESKLLNIQKKNRSNKISEDVKMNIINFLEQDCNSRMCAGKKETVTKKKVKKQKSTEHFLEAVCCDKYNEECTSRKCKNCDDRKIVYGEFDNNIKINVMKWENVCEQVFLKRTGKYKSVKKISKVNHTLSPYDVVKQFENVVPIILNHHTNIVHQYAAIKKL
ncbi:unnamed protein product [Parnassius apollo]|uniref:(apollo) hypothetical protein n=1 Tax=Parnassius apollo TaxID=110799 RepID=A0A8S3W791_PARAO|nr:unnamed protein product [Parnassius apollo]